MHGNTSFHILSAERLENNYVMKIILNKRRGRGDLITKAFEIGPLIYCPLSGWFYTPARRFSS